jgi:hypothetical protein
MPYNFVNINGQHKQLNFTNVKVVILFFLNLKKNKRWVSQIKNVALV